MEALHKDLRGLLHGNSRVHDGRRRLDGILELLHVCLVGRVDAGTDRRRCRVAQLLLAEVLLANVFHGFRWIVWHTLWVKDRPQNQMDCIHSEISQGEGMQVELGHLVAKVAVRSHHIIEDEEVS